MSDTKYRTPTDNIPRVLLTLAIAASIFYSYSSELAPTAPMIYVPKPNVEQFGMREYDDIEQLKRTNAELLAKVLRLESDAYRTASELQNLKEKLDESEKQRMPDYESFSRAIGASMYRAANIAQGEQHIWAIKSKMMPEYFVEYSTVSDEHTGRAKLIWKSSHNITYIEYVPKNYETDE